MINFNNKTGFFNYQGVLIEGTGKGYKCFGKTFSTFGEVIITIQNARKALSLSLNR